MIHFSFPSSFKTTDRALCPRSSLEAACGTRRARTGPGLPVPRAQSPRVFATTRPVPSLTCQHHPEGGEAQTQGTSRPKTRTRVMNGSAAGRPAPGATARQPASLGGLVPPLPPPHGALPDSTATSRNQPQESARERPQGHPTPPQEAAGLVPAPAVTRLSRVGARGPALDLALEFRVFSLRPQKPNKATSVLCFL